MLILASKSLARRKMLQDAGIEFTSHVPEFDEATVKQSMSGFTPVAIAEKLAEGKALSVSKTHAKAFVIGSDQTLECDGAYFSKPSSIHEARQHLNLLKGRKHQLHAAATLALDGKILWTTCETVTLTMRNFTDQFLLDYLAAEADEILHCVGAYRFEGRGQQLFEKVEGGYHAILGMPLLPLLQKLRDHGLIAT
jgi:septum formation protein